MFFFFSIKNTMAFNAMYGFFRFFNKVLSKLICTRQFDLIRSNLILIYLFRDTNSVIYSGKYQLVKAKYNI